MFDRVKGHAVYAEGEQLVGSFLNQAKKFVGGVTGQSAAAAVVQPERN